MKLEKNYIGKKLLLVPLIVGFLTLTYPTSLNEYDSKSYSKEPMKRITETMSSMKDPDDD